MCVLVATHEGGAGDIIAIQDGETLAVQATLRRSMAVYGDYSRDSRSIKLDLVNADRSRKNARQQAQTQ